MSLRRDESGYKCTLDEDTVDKAKRELGEKEETRLIEVDILRKRILKIPGLNPRTDANFLLRFLRVRKFDQEKAFQSIQNFYEIQKKHPGIFDDLSPSRVRHMLDKNYIEILKDKDKQGCRVMILRAANWDEDRYSMIEPLKVYVVCLLKLQEEEENQIHGLHFVFDLGCVTWKQALHWTPSVAKLGLDILQAMVPMRLTRIDYVRQPGFFSQLFPIFKQFMKDKFIRRICMNDETFSGLHSTLDPDQIPLDYGGKLENNSYTEWKDELYRSERQFIEDNKYGFVSMDVSNEKAESSQQDAGLQGMGGTFRKLDN